MTVSEKTKEVKELAYKIAKNIPFHFLLNVTINKNEVAINDLIKIIVKKDKISKFRYVISKKIISFNDVYWTNENFDYYTEQIYIVQDVFEYILTRILYEASQKVEDEINAKNLL